MNRIALSLLASIAVVIAAASAQQTQPEPLEARDAFDTRQKDLVALAAHLGALHRYHLLCGASDDPNLFRDRLRRLVPLESPMERTRQAMIAAFNRAYGETSQQYLTCTPDVEDAFRTEARAALELTDRLHGPFRAAGY